VLPLAHAGHYAVWVLYALPFVVVVGAIFRTTFLEKRKNRENR
jgi:hypothetical protein